MLVLTRKALEAVIVGVPETSLPMLTITVLAIEGGQVRLGFEADSALPIHRQEVWLRLHAAGAGRPPPDPAAPDTD